MDGVAVPSAEFLDSGALKNDRKWALFNEKKKYLNAKRTPLIQQIRNTFNAEISEIEIHPDGGVFSLVDLVPLEAWCSDVFEEKVSIGYDEKTGFPDDDKRLGPTVVSAKTLQSVAEHFGIDYSEAIRRFRPNVIIDGPETFEEDLWVGQRLEGTGFSLELVKHCNRCVVPTRDSNTGMASESFKTAFAELRKLYTSRKVLSIFDHHYKLALNTHALNQKGHQIKVGEEIRLV